MQHHLSAGKYFVSSNMSKRTQQVIKPTSVNKTMDWRTGNSCASVATNTVQGSNGFTANENMMYVSYIQQFSSVKCFYS